MSSLSGGLKYRYWYLRQKIFGTWIKYNVGILLHDLNQREMKVESILDVGCGDGLYLEMLAKLDPKCLVGIDRSMEQLSLTKYNSESCPIDYIQADAVLLPFRDTLFSLVFSKDLLHHERKRVGPIMMEMNRVSSDNVVIAEAARGNPLNDLWIKHGHDHFFARELMKLAVSLGLQPSQYRGIHAYPWPLLPLVGVLEALWDICVSAFAVLCHLFPGLLMVPNLVSTSFLPPSFYLFYFSKRESQLQSRLGSRKVVHSG